MAVKEYISIQHRISAVRWTGNNRKEVEAFVGKDNFKSEPMEGIISIKAPVGCFVLHQGEYIGRKDGLLVHLWHDQLLRGYQEDK